MKDEGSNLNTMTFPLKIVLNGDFLGLEESYQCTYFGHAFSKVYQYVTTNEFFCKDFIYVSIKIAHTNM